VTATPLVSTLHKSRAALRALIQAAPIEAGQFEGVALELRLSFEGTRGGISHFLDRLPDDLIEARIPSQLVQLGFSGLLSTNVFNDVLLRLCRSDYRISAADAERIVACLRQVKDVDDPVALGYAHAVYSHFVPANEREAFWVQISDLPTVEGRIAGVNGAINLAYLFTAPRLFPQRRPNVCSPRVLRESVAFQTTYASLADEIASILTLALPRRHTPTKGDGGQEVVFLFQDMSPRVTNTLTKLAIDYSVALAKCDAAMRMTILLLGDHVIGHSRGVGVGSHVCDTVDFDALIRHNAYDISHAQRNRLKLDDSLKKAERYVVELAQRLQEYKPNVCVYFGARPSPVLAAVSKVLPTVYVPIQIGLAPSVTPTIECVLPHDPRLKDLTTRSGQHRYEVLERHVVSPFRDSVKTSSFKRPESSIVVVTPGVDIDIRVPREEWRRFVGEMCRILAAYPVAHWLVIGIKDERVGTFLDLVRARTPAGSAVVEQISLISYELAFRQTLGKCDIVAMPRHKGAAIGIRIGMEEGVAVMVFVDNDANANVPQEYIHENTDSFFSHLESLISDPDRLRAAKARAAEHFKTLDMRKATLRFLSILNQAQDEWTAMNASRR